MTKQQLVEAVAKDTGTPKAAVETTLDSTLKAIGDALQANDSVELRGFGSFVVKDKKARQGRNPRTGETIEIAAKREVSFRAASLLKEKLLGPEVAVK